MTRFVTVSLFVVMLAACNVPPTVTPAARVLPTPTTIPTPIDATPQTLTDSDWAGVITHTNGITDAIVVHLTAPGGTLSIQPRTPPLTIGDLQSQGMALDFKVIGQTPMHFSGQFIGPQIQGQVEQTGESSAFTLWPILNLTDDALSEFLGTYRFESGTALSINLSPSYSSSGLDFFWTGLTLNHFGTGAVRGLYPIAADAFLVGSARVIGYPFTAQITFERDQSGNVSGLVWQSRDAATGQLGNGQRAVRLTLPSETVHYTSTDGITLTGLLTLPDTPGRHAAIVVLHGSERGTRNDFGRQQMSAFMASQGLAVLTYDKRGVGDSGGVYQEYASESNLSLLAQDALAGVNYLKGRPEIDSRRIGLIGASQAGWIIPLAAAQSADVRFFIILSGPVVSVGTESQYSSYTNNGDSPSSYSSEDISKKLATASPSGFDPLPVIAGLQQPGLWLWGDQDQSVPVPESLSNLKGLIAQGRANFTYQVFPNADHNLQQSSHGLFDEIPYSAGFPEDYYTTLTQWLQHQLPP